MSAASATYFYHADAGVRGLAMHRVLPALLLLLCLASGTQQTEPRAVAGKCVRDPRAGIGDADPRDALENVIASTSASIDSIPSGTHAQQLVKNSTYSLKSSSIIQGGGTPVRIPSLLLRLIA